MKAPIILTIVTALCVFSGCENSSQPELEEPTPIPLATPAMQPSTGMTTDGGIGGDSEVTPVPTPPAM